MILVEEADNDMTKVVLGALVVLTIVSYSSAAFKVWRRKRKVTQMPKAKGAHQAELTKSSLIDLSLSFPLFALVLAITSLGCAISYVMEGEITFKFLIRMSFMLVIVILKPMTIYLNKPRVREWLGRKVDVWMENTNFRCRCC